MTTATTTEKPILFSTELVQAILDGRKTQTRRVIKPQPDNKVNYVESLKDDWWEFSQWYPDGDGTLIDNKKCPYGKPADELWVRETWQALQHGSYEPFDCKPSQIPEQYADLRYKADEGETQYSWKPSIHMPRWASRIQLSVDDIRVERVQEITEEDAKAEGIERTEWKYSTSPYRNYEYERMKPGHNCSTARKSFQTLWDSINADRDYSWESNPWVWVVEFSIKNIKG